MSYGDLKAGADKHLDCVLYVIIAMVMSLGPFVANGMLPRWVGIPLAMVGNGAAVWKAKRSKGSSSNEKA